MRRTGSPSGGRKTGSDDTAAIMAYSQSHQIPKLAEVLLDAVLLTAPRFPLVILTRKCAELHEMVKDHPSTPLPWAHIRVDVTPYSDNTGATSGFNYASKDYIVRQRLACILDDWYLTIVNSKPPSPALFSKNFFLQRSVARALVRLEGNEASSEEEEPEPEEEEPEQESSESQSHRPDAQTTEDHVSDDLSDLTDDASPTRSGGSPGSPHAENPSLNYPETNINDLTEGDAARRDEMAVSPATVSPATVNPSMEPTTELAIDIPVNTAGTPIFNTTNTPPNASTPKATSPLPGTLIFPLTDL